MTSDGKLPETSPDTLDEAFFSRESAAGLAGETAAHDRPSVTARPTGAPVASSTNDELDRVHDLAPDFDEDAVLGRKRGLHVGAFVLVFLGAVLGGTAGYFALRQSSSKETLASSTSASASSSARGVAAVANSASAPVAIVSTSSSAKTAPASTVGARTASKGGSPTDTAGFAGANSGAGLSPSDQALAKGELSAGEISGVVERNRPLIKRRCWQPEVSARQGMGGSARVTTSFTIGPSGAVQSASASGAENDYPGLAGCIAARIREWKFPASASATPVNVPFVFAAQ